MVDVSGEKKNKRKTRDHIYGAKFQETSSLYLLIYNLSCAAFIAVSPASKQADNSSLPAFAVSVTRAKDYHLRGGASARACITSGAEKFTLAQRLKCRDNLCSIRSLFYDTAVDGYSASYNCISGCMKAPGCIRDSARSSIEYYESLREEKK